MIEIIISKNLNFVKDRTTDSLGIKIFVYALRAEQYVQVLIQPCLSQRKSWLKIKIWISHVDTDKNIFKSPSPLG